MELHYFEELRTQELGEVLGLPQGTVKTRLRRARSILGEHLRRLARGPLAEQTIASLDEWMSSVRRAIDRS